MPHAKSEKTPSFLYGSLLKKHWQFLSREQEILKPMAADLNQYRRNPYPIDFETAEALNQLAQDYVLPWPVFEGYIQEWVYAKLFGSKTSAIGKLKKITPAAMRTTPTLNDLQLLVDMDVEGDSLVLSEVFQGECDILRQWITDSAFETPDIFGRYLEVAEFPMGTNMAWTRVPLVENVWLDRRVIELCEISATFIARDYIRLPPVDPHPCAWQRFFPKGSKWSEAPEPLNMGRFFSAPETVSTVVRDLPSKALPHGNRAYVHVGDYAKCSHRMLPGDLLNNRVGAGIAVTKWNAWIEKIKDENGLSFLSDFPVARIGLPVPFGLGLNCRPELSAMNAEWEQKERAVALEQLIAISKHKSLAAPECTVLTRRQRQIKRVLAGGNAMTRDELCKAVICDSTTLYRPGGIKELLDNGIVANKRQLGGYYLVNDPPEQF